MNYFENLSRKFMAARKSITEGKPSAQEYLMKRAREAGSSGFKLSDVRHQDLPVKFKDLQAAAKQLAKDGKVKYDGFSNVKFLHEDEKTYPVHGDNKPYVIRFTVDGKAQEWIRYNSKGMEAALKDAKEAIAEEFPGKAVRQLRIESGSVNEAVQTEADIYKIGASGLMKLGGEKVAILPNREYWMGASSSPDHIVVTAVDDKWITFMRFPYTASQKIETAIGKSLIDEGSRTHLKRYSAYMSPLDKSSLEDLLRGGKGREVDPGDFKRIEVKVKFLGTAKDDPRGDKSGWYAAEHYGGVGSEDLPDGSTILTIHTDVASLKQIKKDKLFRIVGSQLEAKSDLRESFNPEIRMDPSYCASDLEAAAHEAETKGDINRVFSSMNLCRDKKLVRPENCQSIADLLRKKLKALTSTSEGQESGSCANCGDHLVAGTKYCNSCGDKTSQLVSEASYMGKATVAPKIGMKVGATDGPGQFPGDGGTGVIVSKQDSEWGASWIVKMDDGRREFISGNELKTDHNAHQGIGWYSMADVAKSKAEYLKSKGYKGESNVRERWEDGPPPCTKCGRTRDRIPNGPGNAENDWAGWGKEKEHGGGFGRTSIDGLCPPCREKVIAVNKAKADKEFAARAKMRPGSGEAVNEDFTGDSPYEDLVYWSVGTPGTASEIIARIRKVRSSQGRSEDRFITKDLAGAVQRSVESGRISCLGFKSDGTPVYGLPGAKPPEGVEGMTEALTSKKDKQLYYSGYELGAAHKKRGNTATYDWVHKEKNPKKAAWNQGFMDAWNEHPSMVKSPLEFLENKPWTESFTEDLMDNM